MIKQIRMWYLHRRHVLTFRAWNLCTILRVRASPASLHCGPWARHIYPSLVLVQPRKTRLCITERLLMGRKESNQTKQTMYYSSVFVNTRSGLPGCVAQSVTCLATYASLNADLGVASSITARFHTFVEIDYEIISTVILLPSAESFKKDCCQLQA